MCPTYRFQDINTNEEQELFMGITEKEEFLKANPQFIQLLNGSPALGDSMRLGIRRPDAAFNDRLKEIKKAHSKGFSRSTVRTFG